MSEKRGAWASNIGFILAAAGSAIGLGNIWKFPGKVGENGGGTFIVVYLIIIVLIGFAIMLAEITLGRKAQKNAVGAFEEINKKWTFVGKIGILTGFIILSYYSVVGGWVLKYITTYLTGADFGDNTATYFTNFVSNPIEPLLWHFGFMAITVFIVIRGVSAGIEKVSKFLMPLLFIVLIAITIRSVTLPGADEGLEFLFQFNASDIDITLIVTALGQAFFSLSLGMGIMITYGSYVSKKDSLPKSVVTIALLDTFIALLAGFAIVCAVFATDKSLIGGQGGGFAFISLPNVFAEMPVGNVFGLLFFLLLFCAAITSAMSILEGTVAFVTEEFKVSRTKAGVLMGSLMALLGCGYSLSQGAMDIKLPWLDFSPMVKKIFMPESYALILESNAGVAPSPLTWQPMGNVMELTTDNLLMPLTALFVCIFVGWVWKPKKAIEEIRLNNSSKFVFAPVWAFLIKFVCPIAIVIILITTLAFGKGVS